MLDGNSKDEVIEEIQKAVDNWSKGKEELESEGVENRILLILSVHPNVAINPQQQVKITIAHDVQTISLFDLAQREKWLKLENYLSQKIEVRPPSPQEERPKRGFRQKTNIVQANPYEDEQTFMQFIDELSTQHQNVVAQQIKSGLFLKAINSPNTNVLKKILECKKQSKPVFDIFMRDNDNKSAFAHVIKVGNLDALKMLVQYCKEQGITINNVGHEIVKNAPLHLLEQLLKPENSEFRQWILSVPTTSTYKLEELAAAGIQELRGDGVKHDENDIHLAELRLKFVFGKEPTSEQVDQNIENYAKKGKGLVEKKEQILRAIFDLKDLRIPSEIDKVIDTFTSELCLDLLKRIVNQEGTNFLCHCARSNDDVQNYIAVKLFDKAYSTNPSSTKVVELVNAKTQGKTPIYMAAEMNNAQFIRLFYKRQKQYLVDCGPIYCSSALMAAAKNGASEAVIAIIHIEPKCLTTELFTTKSKDEEGKTLAHYLAQSDTTGEAFCALLNSSGIKTAQPFREIMLIEDKEGNSVFDSLMQNENAPAVLAEIVKTMKTWSAGWGLEHIFDINQPRKNKNGLTDLEWVIKNGPPEILKILRENIHDKALFNAAFTKMHSEEEKKSSVDLQVQEVEAPQSRSTVCGVRVSTFGSRNKDTSGIMHEVDTQLWGGNVGHATLTLTIPASDENKELIRKYCIDANIPYEKQKIVSYKQTGPGAQDKEIAHDEEVYIINWSWWPGSNGGHELVRALNLDGLEERRAVHREWAPQFRPLFAPETRTHPGMIGRTHMTYGTTGIVHGRGLSDEELKIIELKSSVPIQKQNKESCSVLIEKLKTLLSYKLSVQEIEQIASKLKMSKEELCTLYEINDIENSKDKNLYFKNLQTIIDDLGKLDQNISIKVLISKLQAKLKLEEPINLGVAKQANTVSLIERFIPARKNELMPDGKTIPFKDLDLLLLDAQAVEAELSKQIEESEASLAQLAQAKQEQETEDKQQLEEEYNSKREELEVLNEEYEKRTVEAENSMVRIPVLEQNIDQLGSLVRFFENTKKSKKGWPKDLTKEENKEILDNIKAIERMPPDLLDINSLSKAKNDGILAHLRKLKQSYEGELGNIKSPKKQKQREELGQNLERVKTEFVELNKRYHQVKSLIPSSKYEQLVANRDAVEKVVVWCDDHLEKSGDPLELSSDFKFWIVESKLMEAKLKESFDPNVDEIVLTREELAQLKTKAKNMIRTLNSQILDVEPCQGIFAIGEFEQFLTLGTTPDHVVDIPLDSQGGVERSSPKGLNAEEMLKRMHYIVENSREGFDLFNQNCSDTSLQILQSGASRVNDDWMRDIFTERATGKLSTPQTVFNTAQSYNHALYHPVQPTLMERMNRNVDTWSPAVFVESVSLKALANPQVDPVSKAFALTLGLPIATLVKGPRTLLTMGYNMVAGPSRSPVKSKAPQSYSQAGTMPLEIEQNIFYIHAYTAQQALKYWEQYLDKHTQDKQIPLLDKATDALFDNLALEDILDLTSKYKVLQKRSLDKMKEVLSGKEPEMVAAPIQEPPPEEPVEEKKKSKKKKKKQ